MNNLIINKEPMSQGIFQTYLILRDTLSKLSDEGVVPEYESRHESDGQVELLGEQVGAARVEQTRQEAVLETPVWTEG